MKKASTRPIGRCENPFCKDPAVVTLVNGADHTRYCDSCLREASGELVADNDRVMFEWNATHDVVTLG